MLQTPNRAFNHVAISVSNIEEVIDWYSKLFGFKKVGPIQHIKRSEQPNGTIFQIYPAKLNEVKVAFMLTGDGAGFEVFEFIDPKHEPRSTQEAFEHSFHRPGFFHICVTDPDPDSLAARVVEAGGRRIGETTNIPQIGMTSLYLCDPWGNVVEVLNMSFGQLASIVASASGELAG